MVELIKKEEKVIGESFILTFQLWKVLEMK